MLGNKSGNRFFIAARPILALSLWMIAGGYGIAAAAAAELEISGRAAVLLEDRSGQVLWARNRDLPLAPASTTKILTALVVLENSKLGDEVTVTAEAAAASGGTVRLREGERLTVEQLLYGMLLRSANDAAIALARHSAGSVAKFVTLMNQKARSLGALQSQFRNPTGLPQGGHMVTARDLAVIARSALAHPAFSRIVAARSYEWKSGGWQGTLKNSNLLLGNYPGAIGVKTGQTKEAGFCLVAAARRGGETFIAVILNGTEQAGWDDARKLLDAGFTNFTSMSLIKEGETVLTSVVDGQTVAIATAAPAHYVGPAVEASAPQMQIALDELQLPIAKGEKVGEAIFRNGTKELGRVALVAQATVSDRLNLLWIGSAAAAVVLAICFFWYKRHRRRHRYIFADRSHRLKF